eukprot:GHUV01042399.1.p1 GENE.GHUV01042399.1~~GHUV01042399.1.p1  ORF type:complete len:234 (-),score=50.73 GHUV01042399.1:49-750(-)
MIPSTPHCACLSVSYLMLTPTCRWLGTFDTVEEAARIYDVAVRALRGPAARCNFWPPYIMSAQELAWAKNLALGKDVWPPQMDPRPSDLGKGKVPAGTTSIHSAATHGGAALSAAGSATVGEYQPWDYFCCGVCQPCHCDVTCGCTNGLVSRTCMISHAPGIFSRHSSLDVICPRGSARQPQQRLQSIRCHIQPAAGRPAAVSLASTTAVMAAFDTLRSPNQQQQLHNCRQQQ